MSAVLQQLGLDIAHHQRTLSDVKQQLGIRHDHFDCWIYGFLENKKFNVEETVQKLRRRDTMERNELACFEITDFMRQGMSKGIIQHIGDDRDGRPTFYIVTKRDSPTAKRREENMRNFDMWVSYGSQLRRHDKRCRLTMLINQKDASMWSNTDMTFQADVALRIAKYYPGVVEKLYLCNMSNTLATLAKPIFSRLPAIVSDRIQIFTDSDMKKGKLLELFDPAVLPLDLGGRNDCDQPHHWAAYARRCVEHFEALQEAVATQGFSVKDWELKLLEDDDMRLEEQQQQQRKRVEHLEPNRRNSFGDSLRRTEFSTTAGKSLSSHLRTRSYGDELPYEPLHIGGSLADAKSGNGSFVLRSPKKLSTHSPTTFTGHTPLKKSGSSGAYHPTSPPHVHFFSSGGDVVPNEIDGITTNGPVRPLEEDSASCSSLESCATDEDYSRYILECFPDELRGNVVMAIQEHLLLQRNDKTGESRLSDSACRRRSSSRRVREQLQPAAEDLVIRYVHEEAERHLSAAQQKATKAPGEQVDVAALTKGKGADVKHQQVLHQDELALASKNLLATAKEDEREGRPLPERPSPSLRRILWPIGVFCLQLYCAFVAPKLIAVVGVAILLDALRRDFA